jgi:hypothetical protein
MTVALAGQLRARNDCSSVEKYLCLYNTIRVLNAYAPKVWFVY